MNSRSIQASKPTATAWVVALTAIGSLMAALDTLVVSTALPTIRLDLGASVEQLDQVPGIGPATMESLRQRLQP